MSNGISLKGIVAPNGTVYHFDHEYLENNPPIPEIDTGLDTEGEAADAAVTGKALDALKEDLNIVQADQEDYTSAVETMLSVLCGILDNGVYITDQSDAIDALRNSLNPTGISIRYVSGTAVIFRLNNTNISWTGTVASVGGSV